MRAIVITAPGGTECLETQIRPDPIAARSEIRIRVVASSLNRADLSQRTGRYPAPAGVAADIPGLEYAGEVESLGADTSLWKVGDRVMGIVGGGGHAELVCVHEREAMRVPENLTWEEAAAIPEVFLTAYDAMFKRLRLVTGETVLVHAVGSGVGTAAVQLATIAGISSIGSSRSPIKLERALALGLTFPLEARSGWENQVMEMTSGKGVEAIVDLVGGNYMGPNLQALAVRGRLVLVGLTAGAKSELDLGAILRKRIRIEGTVLRARPIEEKIDLARDFSARMLGFFESGRLKAIIDRVLPFDKIREAHGEMESNQNFGKIVLRW